MASRLQQRHLSRAIPSTVDSRFSIQVCKLHMFFNFHKASGRLAELAMEASLPNGFLNIVHGTSDIVDTISSDEDVRAISYVGSNTLPCLEEYILSPITGSAGS